MTFTIKVTYFSLYIYCLGKSLMVLNKERLQEGRWHFYMWQLLKYASFGSFLMVLSKEGLQEVRWHYCIWQLLRCVPFGSFLDSRSKTVIYILALLSYIPKLEPLSIQTIRMWTSRLLLNYILFKQLKHERLQELIIFIISLLTLNIERSLLLWIFFIQNIQL